MPLTNFTGTLGRNRAAHLLRRACAGGSKQEIDQFANLTAQEAVSLLFDPNLPEPPLPLEPTTGLDWLNNIPPEDTDLDGLWMRWSIGQMFGEHVDESKRLSYIFRERLVFYLHTHFTTKRSVVNSAKAIYYQQALFRLFAFDNEDFIFPVLDPETGDPVLNIETGEEIPPEVFPKNFKELTKKISVDNAMLVFLDGRFNLKGSPNENYARELLELYSIGKGLEGNTPEPEFVGDYFYFSEEDVVAGAQVLSGFNVDTSFNTIDPVTNLPRGVIRNGQHVEGTKTFSSRMRNAQVIPDDELQLNGNPTAESVIDEVSQLVEIIYEDREAAIHTCRKLYRFFVYHEITSGLQNDIIESMADVFITNGYKIQPVLEALFTSSHFYDAEDGANDNNFGAIIKSPLDLAIGFYRSFGIALPDYETSLIDFYDKTGDILRSVDDQGMNYYEPFEVAGYSAYHQFPIFNRNWITTNYLTSRYDFIDRHISNGMDLQPDQVDIYAYVRNNFSDVATNPRDLILELTSYHLPYADNLSFEESATSEITNERLNYFLEAFLYSPQIDDDPEAGWAERWTNERDLETVRNQLVNLFNALLQTPEYQLM